MSRPKSKWDPEHYDDKFSFVYQYGEDLFTLLDPKPGERILDLGCGTGELTELIHQSGAEVIGMDKSQDMIRAARSKYPHLEFVVSDATTFQFDSLFDAIFSNATLHWILDYRNCIHNMFKNLKVNGKLILEFGGKGNIQNIIRPLRAELSKRGFSTQANLQIWYFPSPADYATELEAAGFRVKSAQHFNRPTKLQGDVKDWLNMFAQAFFVGIPDSEAEAIKNEVQIKASGKCLKNGLWFADYKRLRIEAIKEMV